MEVGRETNPNYLLGRVEHRNHHHFSMTKDTAIINRLKLLSANKKDMRKDNGVPFIPLVDLF